MRKPGAPALTEEEIQRLRDQLSKQSREARLRERKAAARQAHADGLEGVVTVHVPTGGVMRLRRVGTNSYGETLWVQLPDGTPTPPQATRATKPKPPPVRKPKDRAARNASDAPWFKRPHSLEVMNVENRE